MENDQAIAAFSWTPHVQGVHTKIKIVQITPGLLVLGVYSIVTHRKCVAKHMITPSIYAVWSTIKPIAAFSCTPRVQEVRTKAEVVHFSPGHLGLGLLFNCHA